MKIDMVRVFVAYPVKAFKYYIEVLGFEEVTYDHDNYLAIVKFPLVSDGPYLLLEPTEPCELENIQII